jgi:hypothetical protein
LALKDVRPLFMHMMVLWQHGTFFERDVTHGEIVGMMKCSMDSIPDFEMGLGIEIDEWHGGMFESKIGSEGRRANVFANASAFNEEYRTKSKLE